MRKLSVLLVLMLAIAGGAIAQVTRGPINQQGTATSGNAVVFVGNNVVKDFGAPPMSSALQSAHIFVGNGSNVATDVAMSGNVTIDNTGATTIANNAVTYARMQDVSATQRVIGRNTAGAGDPEEVTASQALDWIGSTRGSILYRGATGWAILSPGASGDVLTSNGAGADPSYQTPSGGGGSGGIPWPAFTAPVNGDFAWINQGGASVTVNANGGIYLAAPANTGDSLRVRKKSAPATPYTITAAILVNMIAVDFQQCGLIWRQSSDGKLITYGYQVGNTAVGDFEFNSLDFTNATTFSASNTSSDYILGNTIVWLRITDNGTNRTGSWSTDGYNFTAHYSEARTTFMTADEVGFFVNETNATSPASCTLLSWAQSIFLLFPAYAPRRRRPANDNDERRAVA